MTVSNNRHLWIRAGLALAIAVGWLMVLAQPASAHTVSGIGATDWVSNITSISPRVPGLTVRVVEDGSRVEIVNHGPEILVYGYSGEPYLRVGPTGVFENLHSAATYLNCSRTGCPLPSGVDLSGAAVWKMISSGQVARYHDHRTHWMGNQEPPDVVRAPNQVHLQADWEIMMTQGSTPITVKGNFIWVPSTSTVPWLLVAAVLCAVGVALGALRAWGLPLALAVLVLTANDVYHAIAIAGFWSGTLSYKVEKFFSGSFYSVVGWVLGLVGAWLLVRRRVDGLYTAVFAGGSAMLFTGLLDFSVLSRSHAPFTASLTVDRATVAISLGLGLGVAIGSLLAIRASNPDHGAQSYEDEDGDLEHQEDDDDYENLDAGKSRTKDQRDST